LHGAHMSVPQALNSLSGGLVLLSAFAMVAIRQVQGVVRYFVIQSMLLAASAFLLGFGERSTHLWALGVITIVAKVIVIPWVLKRTLSRDLYVRREIEQVLNIPASLLLVLFLVIASELLVGPVASIGSDPAIRVNLPVGLACVLIGAYSLMSRREAIPQLIGILAMENGAFFAGIAIASELPLIAELAVAIDVVLIALIVGLLTRDIKRTIGTTEAAELSKLREEPARWR
jgi:hydrogenase-4 component E